MIPIVYGSPSLRLSLDRTGGQNGEKLYLTITRTKARALGTVVFVESTLGPTVTNWPIAVSQCWRGPGRGLLATAGA